MWLPVAEQQLQHVERRHSEEAEIKVRVAGAAEHARLRSRLRELGAERLDVYDEENVRYRPVRHQPVTLRLRIVNQGPNGILTVKGPARYERRIKIREETEVTVADAVTTMELLQLLGHKVAVIYHKHRETWRLGECHVTLDTLDFGFFSEIEGPPEAIEVVAKQVGLDTRRALKSSYSALARAHLKSGTDGA